MKLVIGIATTGRSEILAHALASVVAQDAPPAAVILCGATESDTAGIDPAAYPFPVMRLVSKRGLTLQRNVILDACGNQDVVLFLDDDFLLGPRYLRNLATLFENHPAIGCATGNLLADGINGPGLSPAEGQHLLASVTGEPEDRIEAVYCGYGCNMAFRLSIIRAHALRFDEALPLYGWQEDLDFSRLIARHGTVVKSSSLVGVHLGVKSGRSSGIRLGYSQVANPVYLIGKATIEPRIALRKIARNVVANCVKSVRPEQYVDRRGRLKGNCIALLDLLAGRLNPRRALLL